MADAAFCPSVTSVDLAPELAVAGDSSAEGIFDPSIVYPAGASGGAMSYSAVPDQTTIRTRVAVSAGSRGRLDRRREATSAPEVASITSSDQTDCPTGTCTGNLISEVSSLVYDADDPDSSRRWKVFAHRYLVDASGGLHYGLGTITLQTAPQPNGPWATPEQLIGWNGPSTYSSTGIVTNISTLAGSSSDCILLTEPGAIALPGAIDLAVGCAYLDNAAIKIRVELLRSVDHAASWVSVGTLVRPEDATCGPPTTAVNAADLFVSGGTEYLAVSPASSTGYDGCLVYPIDDPATGHVQRDAQGRAIIVRQLAASRFSGACTFADGSGGYALDVGFLDQARKFRIFEPAIATP